MDQKLPNRCKASQRIRAPEDKFVYIFTNEIHWKCESFDCSFNPDFPDRCPFAGHDIERDIEGMERACHCPEAMEALRR